MSETGVGSRSSLRAVWTVGLRAMDALSSDLLEFFPAKRPVLAGCQCWIQGDISHGLAVEIGHADVELGEHAFHLVVLTLVDGQSAAVARQHLNGSGPGGDFLLGEIHSALEGLYRIVRTIGVGCDKVALWNPVSRVGQGFGKAAVVGEDDESGGGSV